MTLVLATARSQIADYVGALFLVYTLLIIAYILSQLFFAFGGRVPYARWSSALLGFLRDVCEPFLSVFRRFIPAIGPLDLSPVVAIFVLQIVGGLITSAIRG
ncbi:MAG: YggT family protein [Solirubrobacteraceae bacterium]